MIKHLFKYLLIVLLAGGFTACSEDEGAQILGGLYEKVDIAPEPGMNLVGRVTDGTGPIEGVVVSDGVTVPSSTHGNAKITRHAASAAQTRKFFVTKSASSSEMPAIRYRPTNGMSAIQMAAMMRRR